MNWCFFWMRNRGLLLPSFCTFLFKRRPNTQCIGSHFVSSHLKRIILCFLVILYPIIPSSNPVTWKIMTFGFVASYYQTPCQQVWINSRYGTNWILDNSIQQILAVIYLTLLTLILSWESFWQNQSLYSKYLPGVCRSLRH